ncbi:hypothetical protein G4228_017932 [Cervus hanglu yarkandensis]|nr:hypothetical protein G4228_017932 [Cervus hanglu yarkandensis]
MPSSLGCLLLCGSIALALGNAQKLPKGKPNLKVHINTTSDSILLKFLRPSPNVKLEGFLLGYGSNLSPNQYFPLPAEGKYTEAIVDAEPKYLIVVRPAPPPSQKKSCSGKKRSRKPLQLVVGTLSPSSVFLSWGFLINPHHDWTLPSQCPNDRYYTIRYREKDKEKKWIFQLCPATETIVENLKPDTVYEFGVKDNVEGGIWSKIFNHKTIVGMIQNVTHRASTKSPDKTPYGGTILVHLVIPGLNETTVKLPTSIMFEISEAIKTQLAKNETLALPAESKTPEVEKIPALPITAPKRLPEFPQAKTPFPFEKAGGTLAPSKTQFISLKPKIPLSPEVTDSKPAPPKTKRPGRRPRPKTTPSPDVPKSKPDSKPAKQLLSKPTAKPDTPPPTSVPVTDLEPVTFPPETSGTTLASKTSQQTIHPHPRPKTTPSTEAPESKPAPKTSKRTRRPRPKLKTTTTPEAPQTKPETDQSTQELFTMKVPRTTELAKTTQVLNKTTTRPSRPRPSGTPRGNGIGAGTRRPPLPPRPMPPRRKPLPPNNVTGKPGSAGPHVRYIQKPDNSPCSITDSVKRFPKEEATEGNATSPPQNPPTNLTVVTVEGCPSFVILDWDKPLNDTVTEYEVISRENGSFSGKNKSIQTTNQTFSTVENLKPDTSYEFQVKPKNPLGEGPPSNTVAFSTESDTKPKPRFLYAAGRDAIWTERPFNSDSYSECKGKQYVKRTWYKKFVGVQLCNSLRYKIYLSDSLTGKFYNIGDQRGHGEDHCQFVDSFLDGRTGQQLSSDQLPTKEGYFRAVRQEPVQFGEIGGHTQINYVQWYECGTTIPGKW